MTDHSGDDRALDQVITELRDAPGPDLDWDRMERQLMSRVDADQRAASSKLSPRVVAILAAAAAVLLVLGVGLLRSGRDQQARLPSSTAPAARVFGPGVAGVDGSQLVSGDRVVAAQRALVVDHPGRAQWTLEAGSQATVEAVGAVLRLRLTAGAISAKVVPSEQPETFVIEVDEVRVAVHGTEFRVVRTAEGVDVSVSEGVVAVGGQSQKPSFFLRARDSGRFSKLGSSGQVVRGAEATLEPTAADPKPAAGAASKPSLPAAASNAAVNKALDQIGAAVARCFSRDGAPGEVGVQVRTQASIAFGANGKLHTMSFEPPLAPGVMECVQHDTAKVNVPESAHGGAAQRSLLLVRDPG
jgi:ferric-dicitrate binding protein FerR (iron transport regulator)